MGITDIRQMCLNKQLRWTQHILIRLLQRNITTADVIQAISSGEIIEEYQDDYPNPSCLILGLSMNEQPLHIVRGIGDNELWLIPAYYPSPDEWLEDLKTRRITK